MDPIEIEDLLDDISDKMQRIIGYTEALEGLVNQIPNEEMRERALDIVDAMNGAIDYFRTWFNDVYGGDDDETEAEDDQSGPYYARAA